MWAWSLCGDRKDFIQGRISGEGEIAFNKTAASFLHFRGRTAFISELFDTLMRYLPAWTCGESEVCGLARLAGLRRAQVALQAKLRDVGRPSGNGRARPEVGKERRGRRGRVWGPEEAP